MTPSARALGLALFVAASFGCRGETVDASPADDGGADGGDAGVPAGVEVLSNPGFELGCAGWATAESTAEESTIARTGSKSCRVCGIAGAGAYFFGQDNVGTFVDGKQYLGEAWLRADDGDAAVAPDPVARLELLDATDNQLDVFDSGSLALDKTWKRAGALIKIKPGTKTLRLELWSHGEKSCFLVDDASLRALP